MRFPLARKVEKSGQKKFPAEHLFEHNFYDFLIFLKRMLGFQEKCIPVLWNGSYGNGSYAFFLVENGTIFRLHRK